MVAVADVEDFAERFGAPAMLFEVLGHGEGIRPRQPEVGAQIVNAQRGRAQTGHEGIARRRANGLIAEGALE